MENIKELENNNIQNNSDGLELFREYHKTKIFGEEGQILYSDKKLRNDLATKNSKLVSFVVNKFYNKTEYRNIKEDLIQEGFLGLFTAIDRFDPERGFKFSTYAVHWVQQACSGFILEHKPSLHVPSHVRTAQNKLLKYMREHEITFKDLDDEIINKLGITNKMISCIDASLRTRNVYSLQEPLSGSADATFADTVPSLNFSSEEQTDINILINASKKALLKLSERERLLILLRYNIITSIEEIKNANQK